MIKFQRTLAATLIAGAALGMTSAAHAGNSTQDAIAVCKTSINENLAAITGDTDTAADISFAKISGASAKKLKFEIKQNDTETDVVCKFKRGKVKDILNADGESILAE